MRNPDDTGEFAFHIAWTSLADGNIHVVARCEKCGVIAERMVERGSEDLLQVIAVEGLAAHRCTHAQALVQTRAVS